MQISVNNPEQQTLIFTIIFLLALFLSIRHKKKDEFSIEITNQIKGFAILTVLFGHIGYFLSSNNQFLFPLSVLSGVGVNLFLIVSGYGLTISALSRPLTIAQFYKKRLTKLFVPYWIVIILFLLLDAFLLHRTYSSQTILQLFIGWTPKADLYQSLDSPLWYFSFILAYYLLFPLVTYKRLILISPLVIYYLSRWLLGQKFPFLIDIGVLDLYKVHILAFPIGMALALITKYMPKINLSKMLRLITWLVLPICLILIGYFAIHSGVGEGLEIEQKISILTSLLIIFVAVILPIEFKLFELFGVFSYEIYLFHWPILYRYDIIYKFLPAGVATAIYLFIFILLGRVFQKINQLSFAKLEPKQSNQT